MSSRTDAVRGWGPAVGLTLVVALGLRAWGLGGPLWYDEILTLVHSVRQPLATIVTTFPDVSQHPLYSVLARVAMDLLGETNWALRLPAMLGGVGMVAVVWLLGCRMLTQAEAWAASAILATSYHHIWFSQNARGYTLLGLCVIASTHLLLRLLDSPRPSAIVAYVVVTALGVYTHMTMALVTAGQACVIAAWLLMRRPGTGSWHPLRLVAAGAGAAIVSLLLYAPFVDDVLRSVGGPPPARASQVATAGWAAAEAVRALLVGAGGLATALGVLLASAGGLSLLRRRTLEVLLLGVPAVSTVGVMLLLGQPVRPRFVFFLAGAAAICVARGLGVAAEAVTRRAPAVRSDAAVVGATLLFVAVSLPLLPRNYRVPKQDFDGAVAWADAQVRAGATVVAVPPACLPVAEYYARPWPCVERAADLDVVARGRDVLVMSTLRDYIADPALRDRLDTSCPVSVTFPGTLGGGDIVICRTSAISGGRP